MNLTIITETCRGHRNSEADALGREAGFGWMSSLAYSELRPTCLISRIGHNMVPLAADTFQTVWIAGTERRERDGERSGSACAVH